MQEADVRETQFDRDGDHIPWRKVKTRWGTQSLTYDTGCFTTPDREREIFWTVNLNGTESVNKDMLTENIAHVSPRDSSKDNFVIMKTTMSSSRRWSRDDSNDTLHFPDPESWHHADERWIHTTLQQTNLRNLFMQWFLYRLRRSFKDQAQEEQIRTVAVSRSSRSLCVCPLQVWSSFVSSNTDSSRRRVGRNYD